MAEELGKEIKGEKISSWAVPAPSPAPITSSRRERDMTGPWPPGMDGEGDKVDMYGSGSVYVCV